jgi:hypothetical protein
LGPGQNFDEKVKAFLPVFPPRIAGATPIGWSAFGGLTMVGTTSDLEGELGRWLTGTSSLRGALSRSTAAPARRICAAAGFVDEIFFRAWRTAAAE